MLRAAAQTLARSRGLMRQSPSLHRAPVAAHAALRAVASASSGAPLPDDGSGGGGGGRQKQFTEEELADHSWRQCNHVWTDAEVAQRMQTAGQKHVPTTTSDHVASAAMRGLYHTFNFVTRYDAADPSAKSIEWRLIILESFAGVPGFLAAGFRHFYSLRTLQRDHGAIYTFLEEAENERMHLLTCLKMFDATFVTRALVILAQVTMTPLLMATYAVHAPMVHRFVGYLEETAVETYSNIVSKCETPGTQLHAAWAHLPAPAIAKNYWCLPDDASWVTTLKHMLADEAHHRDVNHTFASLPKGVDNPFIHEHQADFDRAVLRRSQVLLKQQKQKQQQQPQQ